MKKYKTAIILFAVFEAIAISLWLTTGSPLRQMPEGLSDGGRSQQQFP